MCISKVFIVAIAVVSMTECICHTVIRCKQLNATRPKPYTVK